MSAPLLQVRGLVLRYPRPRQRWWAGRSWLTAVAGVDLDLAAGEILGVVGESGSGKSSLARAIAGLLAPAAGTVALSGVRLAPVISARTYAQRRHIQMIFQDPYASLDPRQSAGAIIAEPLRNYGLATSAAALDAATALMAEVGLDPALHQRYPHEFSGGQRQRIGVARALAPQPELIICDEPVSALDVSVQAQILNLLADLRQQRGLALLFIAHDLAVVRHLCDRIAVMYAGHIVEMAPRDALFATPRHPYTRALLRAVPRLEAGAAAPAPVLPEATRPMPALGADEPCPYLPRCHHADARCVSNPALQGDDDHRCACWQADERG